MGEKTSHRRINHKVKDPLAHERDEDTVPKWKVYRKGRHHYEGEDEEEKYS